MRTSTTTGTPINIDPRLVPLVAAILGLLNACAQPATPQQSGIVPGKKGDFIRGRVTHVADGDTLNLQVADGRQLRIRLAEIDTPEKGEAFANVARAELRRLVQDRDVFVRLFDVDDYGRTVGRVYVDDIDVNAVLVEKGLAVVYRRWAEDPRLFRLEEEARQAKRGLWSGERLPRGAGGQRRVTDDGKRHPDCGDKRYCREMDSCAEALFYLNQCGAQRIDGDNNGLPCERSLCSSR